MATEKRLKEAAERKRKEEEESRERAAKRAVAVVPPVATPNREREARFATFSQETWDRERRGEREGREP